MLIFSSGSERLVSAIDAGSMNIIPIHSHTITNSLVMFLGKLHNTKQHIQFIKYIKDEITLSDDILTKFLTTYANIDGAETIKNILFKKKYIKSQFDNCEIYIFEICSLNLYKNNEFEVQSELTEDYTSILQTDAELLEDLNTIRGLIPINAKLVLQVHFRPNIIYNDESLAIENREVIYNVINTFCGQNENTFIYDPSILLQTDPSLFDGENSFTQEGYKSSYKYIYDNFILTPS